MYQVKIFYASKYSDLENLINEWFVKMNEEASFDFVDISFCENPSIVSALVTYVLVKEDEE